MIMGTNQEKIHNLEAHLEALVNRFDRVSTQKIPRLTILKIYSNPPNIPNSSQRP